MHKINIGDEITDRRHKTPKVSFNATITGVSLPGGQSNWQVVLDRDFPPLVLASIFVQVASALVKAAETDGNDPLDLPR